MANMRAHPSAGRSASVDQVDVERRNGARRSGAGPADEPFGSLLTPIPMRSAGERIAERIVTAIALGEFVPGQRLPTERDLAAMLEVSRATVREALQRLQASGYVTTKRGRSGGTFVLTSAGPESDDMIARTLMPAWTSLIEILDFRRLVEQMIASAAAERRDAGDVAQIRQAVDAYAAAPDRNASRLADHGLHQAIASATHNPRLAELSAKIRREVSLGFDAEPYTPDVRHRALRQHPLLAQAVIEGDPDQAAQLAAAHFLLTEDMLRELYARITVRSDPSNSTLGMRFRWPADHRLTDLNTTDLNTTDLKLTRPKETRGARRTGEWR